tara:strand:+ start:261 stop:545 length:285 start_codon:yes stop_codon:yes gene_type:complete
LALRDETLELRPEVPLVGFSPAASGVAERLAWETAGPNRSSWIPPGELEGEGPPPDPGKEVTLGVSPKLVWLDIYDAPLVHVSGRDESRIDQVP